VADLRVRVYNVRFGDAILVSVPETAGSRTAVRHILIDVGNVLRGEGGEDAVFAPVLEDVRSVLAGRPLDLYVMTHEHLDHVQGLLYASARLGIALEVRYAWITASAAADYYDNHPDAKRHRLEAANAYHAASRYMRAASPAEAELLWPLMVNNNPQRTAECVAYLRGLADTTTYVYRGCDLRRTHPFREATLAIWAPEEDTSVYYGAFHPVAIGVRTPRQAEGEATLTVPRPPPGVDSGAFYQLVDARRRGYFDNLLAIDRAANNSSVVFSLDWRGYTLLFPGDAEHRSWREMDKRGMLRPVHFLKVAHHGSWNGTPKGDVLDKVMPPRAPDRRTRYAAVSTCEGTYNNVPDREMLGELAERCEVRSVEDTPQAPYVDFTFAG
jgi:beta-lactamase superfamily II metal-dependent hydrolase